MSNHPSPMQRLQKELTHTDRPYAIDADHHQRSSAVTRKPRHRRIGKGRSHLLTSHADDQAARAILINLAQLALTGC